MSLAKHKGKWVITHPIGVGGHLEFSGYIEITRAGVLSLFDTNSAGYPGDLVRVFGPGGWLSVMDKDSEKLFPRVVPNEHTEKPKPSTPPSMRMP